MTEEEDVTALAHFEAEPEKSRGTRVAIWTTILVALLAFGYAGTAWYLQDKVPNNTCLLYTSPSPRDGLLSRMPSSA